MFEHLPPYPCYLGRGTNGEFTTIDQAKISVMDRGFIFGDGVYEVFVVYGGQPFRLPHHMARLERSLKEMRISNPHTREQWQELVAKLVAPELIADCADSMPVNTDISSKNALIYLQITRGVALRDHVMPKDIEPTVFMMRSPLNLPSQQAREQGVACVSADDFRWEKAHIKSTSLLGSVFARQISFDVGATETVMFRRGYLSEAASSNVWVVKDGALMGVPKDNLVLEGIRFGLIEEICKAQGIPFSLRRITREEVFAADELLLTSATKEVLPITQLDGQPVGNGAHKGKPGPVYQRLYAGYQDAKIAV
ncbi:aminotransferase class IV [Variovorax sp. PCZ-1]|uniref:aminotransferase class IV n=1 Tax=Variovorax sp. PCZ-1 TaxID=2835533 RepID=UPI001BCA7339|nr:aminotransferase class IV [Variovorax sp. PCZ-1]MBS7806288.1 aminotransferase class IV [Variovorax sp. PCZ-1]